MTNTNDNTERNIETNNEPRTFMIWELAVLYRQLGLAAVIAEKAAIADLRMFHSQTVEPQCQAA